MSQADKARAFAALHVKGNPVILFNAWDPGSARAVAAGGARAIATGSWSVAAANGFADGEELPLDIALANAERIVGAVDLPVTLDFEGGYAEAPDDVAKNITAALKTGVIGFNFEDQVVGGEGMYSIADQTARIRAIRAACDAAGVHAWINARTDIFLQAKPDTHDDAKLNDAIERAQAYGRAGGNSFFAPGLMHEDKIRRLCEASPLPVNIMWFDGVPPPRRLGELGVGRVSYGPGPYRLAMAFIEQAAREIYGAA
jgi:2-methylisocitrate lyase-like PEP mutase family enzyme